ncbi:carboxymuconolactone decarboxylase family protein, partial [Desulfobacterales bacterium HSG17]|nr:carboxymuconolactone decarboxylase family protein [Desulfobacterales bacterium HSG17]
TIKEKEIVAVSVSVASGCKPCTNYHFKKAREADAQDEEIQKAISEAMCVLASAKAIMNSHGLRFLGVSGDNHDCGCTENTTRMKELVSLGAAFAINCTSNLKKHIAVARTAGISDEEIKSVMELALFIKEKAASHVNRIADDFANKTPLEKKSEKTKGCGCDKLYGEPTENSGGCSSNKHSSKITSETMKHLSINFTTFLV